MKPRPTIFLSGVSQEFHTFRDAIEHEIEMKGCFAENQPGFPPDYRTVEEMLTRKLHDSDAVIHIVGFRFGAEPHQRPPGVPRRSYTQMEFDIARKLEKPIYVFISKDSTVRQPPPKDEQPEDPETVALQLAHRQAVTQTNHLYYNFGNLDDLRRLVAEIPIVAKAEFRVDISRILKYAPEHLIGRETDTQLLNDAWLKVRRAEPRRPHVLTFVALGGEGKTSLVAKWAATLADDNWPGCDAAFAWSFYSQGTRDQQAASSDLFLKEALTFFGDETDQAFADSPAGAYQKGQRLAHIIGQRRCLLILDGLEPLQYAPTSPTPGELKDQGIAALLKGLATVSQGLCVITTRYPLPDLKAFRQTTASEVPLLRLSKEAGIHLLQQLGVRKESGSKADFEKLVEDVKGHALTLTLLGGFLKRAFKGDIRQRDRVKFEKADEKMDGGHAFRTMAAYEQWLLRDGGDEGRREVAVLRLMGLFDRPADAGCLAALRGEPVPGLTEPLDGLDNPDWEFCLTGLESAKLLTVNRDKSAELLSLDAHPHLRAYFAKQLSETNSEAWRVGHQRLYEYLSAATQEGDQPTLESLQPLYQAVTHGCKAGLHCEVFKSVYWHRISRATEYYSTYILGANDLPTLSAFNGRDEKPVLGLDSSVKGCLMRELGFHLWYQGRLSEAIPLLQEASDTLCSIERWEESGDAARLLSEANLAMGQMARAEKIARKAIEVSEKSRQIGPRIWQRCALLNVLHGLFHMEAAIKVLDQIHDMACEDTANVHIHGPFSFWVCDFLISLGRFEEAIEMASRALISDEQSKKLLGQGLDHLSLGLGLLLAPAGICDLDKARTHIELAMQIINQCQQQPHICCALVARAQLNCRIGAIGEARQDLDEAMEIAERGPMRLFQADIHLHRARLFFREPEYPWESPATDLAAAETLINTCGYHRRDEELADAKRVIFH